MEFVKLAFRNHANRDLNSVRHVNNGVTHPKATRNNGGTYDQRRINTAIERITKR